MTEFETSDRGFKHYQPIKTTYGAEVSVYESSAARGPHIWLKISQPDPKMAGQLERAQAFAHMSIEQAEQVRDAIDAAIAYHYQRQETA